MAATTEQVNGLLQEMQRMNNRLQAAEQAAADAGTRVQQAEQTASAAADQAAAAQRQQITAGNHTTRLVDTRSLGKPREFKSVREDWKDWRFQFKAFLCGANPDAGHSRDTRPASRIAMTKLQNVEAHNGLETWRQLILEFEPRAAGRRRPHLTNLLRPCLRPAKTNNMEKLGERIEHWEREVRDYERVCKKALDEEIKIGVLACLAPDKSYVDARKVVFDLDAHRAHHAAGAAVPMDVDALTQKGGKGKDGKGRKYGGQEG
eukprot:3874958-Amphidinium_carterae.1